MTPSEFAAEIRSVLVEAANCDERSDLIAFSARLPVGEVRTRWLRLVDHNPDCVASISIVYAETDVVLTADADADAGEVFDVIVRKNVGGNVLRVFLAENVGDVFFRSEIGITAVCVAELGDQESFCTFAAHFQRWSDHPVDPYRPPEELKDPRKLVRDYSGQGLVPSDIGRWMLRREPEVQGDAFRSWRVFAARNLLAAVVDHVSDDKGVIAYHLSGPPRVTFMVTDDQLTDIFDNLTLAAHWIYVSGRDVDTRHLFFTAEFARNYRADGFDGAVHRCLESAKTTYGAHAKSASRETLKAIAELRKNILDETRAVAQRAHELSTSLWRDLIVAAAPFVLRMLPGGTKVGDGIALAFLAIVAAVFLAFSFFVQVWLNSKHFSQQKSSRDVWRQLLVPYISGHELDEFSDSPVRETMAVYSRARLLVGIAYGLLIVMLLGFACVNISSSKVQTESTSSQTEQTDDTPSAASMLDFPGREQASSEAPATVESAGVPRESEE